MSKKQINKLMSILLSISGSLIVIGFIFKLQHYPYGKEIISTGLISSFVIGTFEIYRLKRIVKAFERNSGDLE